MHIKPARLQLIWPHKNQRHFFATSLKQIIFSPATTRRPIAHIRCTHDFCRRTKTASHSVRSPPVEQVRGHCVCKHSPSTPIPSNTSDQVCDRDTSCRVAEPECGLSFAVTACARCATYLHTAWRTKNYMHLFFTCRTRPIAKSYANLLILITQDARRIKSLLARLSYLSCLRRRVARCALRCARACVF